MQVSVALQDEQAFVSTIAGPEPAGRAVDLEAVRLGTALGRYVLVRLLGEGGMGRVYAAYDRDLDRKVAIKVLARPPTDPVTARHERARMLQEAQTLARLAHPNVVAVHDVGTFGDQVYVAMEYVECESLRGWVTKPRPWPRVLEVMVGLAEGVAAAHAAGVLHTDIKPDNAIIGRDGRVRLVDFGLARRFGRAVTDAPDDRDAGRTVPTSDRDVVEGVAGTPGYMAPEQLNGEVVAASDQFALCATMWELLYGRRPWYGRTSAQLAFAMGSRPPELPTSPPHVPTWLREVLERGMAPEPSGRFCDVEAVVVALRGGRARQRRRRSATVFAAAAACVAALIAHRELVQWSTRRSCEREASAGLGDWKHERRAQLQLALVGTGLPYAASTTQRGVVAIDAYVQAWNDARTEACLRTELRASWGEDTGARARLCLDSQASQAQSWIAESLVHPRPAVQSFARGAATLAAPEDCLDLIKLAAFPPPPPELAERVRGVQDDLARVSTLAALGDTAEALTLAEDARERAAALDWAPLSSDAALTLSRTHSKLGAFAEAEAAAEDAYFITLREDLAPEITAAAAEALVLTTGTRLGRWTDARRWLRSLEAAVRSGDPAGEARLATARGHVAVGEADLATARTQYELALLRYTEVVGPHHPYVAVASSNVANVLLDLGEITDGIAIHRRALAVVETSLGEEHPDVANALQNLSRGLFLAERYDEALSVARRGLALREAAFGPESPLVLDILFNVATIEAKAGSANDALLLQRRVLQLTERIYGPGHIQVAAALSSLAVTYQGLGNTADALPLLKRALAIEQEQLGVDHPSLWHSRVNLGATLQLAKDHLGAIAEFEAAQALIVRAYGGRSVHELMPLAGIAESALELQDVATALDRAERAVALADLEGTTAELRAYSTFLLSKALWYSARPGSAARTQAVEHARRARQLYSQPGTRAEGVAGVDAWLVELAREQPQR